MKYTLLGAVSTIALGAAFGVGTPGAANAALTCVGTAISGTCSETDKVSVSDQDFTNNPIPVDYFIAPFLGDILNSVTYSVGGTVQVVGTLSNTGAGVPTSGFFVVSKDNFTFAGGTPSSFLNPTILNVGPVFFSPTVTLNPGQAAKFAMSNPFNSGNIFPGPAGYTKTGTFNALVNTSTNGGPSPYFSSSQTANQTAFVTIVYNYALPPPPPPSPTPEPASLALLGVGLAGLGAIRRRRKA
jgi:hypothetical protein